MNSISFISAFDTEKNIGKEYNRLIENINDEWIFIKDGDCLFLTTDYGDRIAKIIDANKDKYDIIGCMTNRLNLNTHHQRIEGMENEHSVTAHIKLSNDLWNQHGTNCKDNLLKPIGAMCMCFKRKVWEQIRFTETDSMHFDKIFCDQAMNLDYKIGIAEGFYVFHLYRWEFKDKPQNHVGHLIKNTFGIKGL